MCGWSGDVSEKIIREQEEKRERDRERRRNE